MEMDLPQAHVEVTVFGQFGCLREGFQGGIVFTGTEQCVGEELKVVGEEKSTVV